MNPLRRAKAQLAGDDDAGTDSAFANARDLACELPLWIAHERRDVVRVQQALEGCVRRHLQVDRLGRAILDLRKPVAQPL